jgi:uncharacterized damage-inducible protein DinB
MSDAATLRDLFRHLEWADARVWAAVVSSPEALADENLRERLKHIHLVTRLFLAHWRGEVRAFAEPTFADTGSLLAWGREGDGAARAHVESAVGGDLAAPSVVPWSTMAERRLGRAAEPTSLGETMLQAALHATYHRGQVNTRLRELGAEPPLTDYIAWVWTGRPEPEWPSVARSP